MREKTFASAFCDLARWYDSPSTGGSQGELSPSLVDAESSYCARDIPRARHLCGESIFFPLTRCPGSVLDFYVRRTLSCAAWERRFLTRDIDEETFNRQILPKKKNRDFFNPKNPPAFCLFLTEEDHVTAARAPAMFPFRAEEIEPPSHTLALF